jgi:hypothetical protein
MNKEINNSRNLIVVSKVLPADDKYLLRIATHLLKKKADCILCLRDTGKKNHKFGKATEPIIGIFIARTPEPDGSEKVLINETVSNEDILLEIKNGKVTYYDVDYHRLNRVKMTEKDVKVWAKSVLIRVKGA